MNFKKSFSKVFGVILNAAEKKALDNEINRQLAERTRKDAIERASMVLWILHIEFGFGPQKLRRFYDSYSDRLNELAEYYDMEIEDQAWLCSRKLKEYGVDVELWEKENEEHKQRIIEYAENDIAETEAIHSQIAAQFVGMTKMT